MKSEAGLWIDHRKAVIVTVSGGTEEIMEIASDVEKDERYLGEERDIYADDHRDRWFMEHLDKYYDEVISHVRGADSVLVIGPGEAKGEFVKRLESADFDGRIVGVEPADKMTDCQIAARVRQQFLVKS